MYLIGGLIVLIFTPPSSASHREKHLISSVDSDSPAAAGL